MMCVDPSEKGAQHKREQIAKLINFTEEQKTIVDLYILEEKTKMRHWELDHEDPNVYLEWMNGTDILRNKINMRLNMTKAQKIAMNNNSQQQQQGNNGNNPQQPKIIRTSSGKEIPAADRPDLLKSANRPKRYTRHG
jgi:hypothetical protein